MMEVHGDIGPADGYDIEKNVGAGKNFKVFNLFIFCSFFIMKINGL